MGLPRVLAEAAFSLNAAGDPEWTDLSDRLRITEGATLAQRGRQYELDQVQPGSVSGWFLNDDGALTPGHLGSPYYPKIQPGVRLRFTILWQSVSYRLSTSSVDSWQAGWPNEFAARNLNQVTATDALKELAKAELRSQMEMETLALGPLAYYPMTEETESKALGDATANAQPNALLSFKGSVDASVIEFASADPPLGGDGQQLPVLHRGSQNAGAMFATGTLIAQGNSSAWTVSAWVATLANQGTETFVPVQLTGASPITIRLGVKRGAVDGGIQGTPFFTSINSDGTSAEAMGGKKLNDGRLHHLVGTVALYSIAPVRMRVEVYLDGVLITDPDNSPAKDVVVTGTGFPLTKLRIGHGTNTGLPFWLWDGTLGHVAVFNAEFSAAQVRALYLAGRDGLPMESSTARAQRLCGYLGAPVGDVDLGLSTMASQMIAGVKLTDALVQISNTEGGMILPNPDGALDIQGRGRRRNSDAMVTLDGNLGQVSDLDFSLDDTLLANDLSYTGAGGAKGRIVDQTSITRLAALSGGTGRYTGSADFPLSTEFEATERAKAYVAIYGSPRPRTQKLRIDLIANSELAPLVMLLNPSDRIDTVNLPDNAPANAMSWVVEHTEQVISKTEWAMLVQASPYDPTRYLQLDAPVFGRLDFGNKIGW